MQFSDFLFPRSHSNEPLQALSVLTSDVGWIHDPAVQGNPSWATMVRDSLARQGENLALYDPACPGETTVSLFRSVFRPT